MNQQQSPATENDSDDVIDDAARDDSVVPQRYSITSFGADYDVEGLVRRLERGDIFIPSFQRNYVWSYPEASRFIESLLLGLPVPGVVLAREPDSNKQLVIDGQQRLKTLQYFYDGRFDPKPDEKRQRVFKLANVQNKFDGKTYESLEEPDRIHLDNAIIHATIVKQDFPQEDDTSIYHIFERLNNGGRRLFPQEIRVAIYHGPFINKLGELNEFESWRAIFGKTNKRLKDQELILRFFALYESASTYARPMAEFLNVFAKNNRNADAKRLDYFESLFTETVTTAKSALGTKAFRPQAGINVAIFDAAMVAIARRLNRGPVLQPETLREAYEELVDCEEFQDATARATADKSAVLNRLELATEFISRAK